MITAEQFNKRAENHLPGHLGIRITHVESGEVRGEAPVIKALMAPNGFLHAGSVVTLADTLDYDDAKDTLGALAVKLPSAGEGGGP